MAIEAAAEWPSLITKIAFLAKRLGGVRPIALLHVVARVQARLRMSIAKEWEAKNSRHYFWAAPGKSCGRAVCQQSVWSEWTTAKGKGAQA
eukprot:8674308-Pyramimonas_sp.AAC.1